MKRNWKRNALIVCCLSAFALNQTACSVIDEDTDDCRAEYDATYELHLVTNEEHEIQRVLLGESVDIADALRNDIAESLREHLKDIFSYDGRDLDLSFYDLNGFLPRHHQEQHSFDGQPVKHVYLSLPVGYHKHLVTANINGNNSASYKNFDQSWHDALLGITFTGPVPAYDGTFTPKYGFPRTVEDIDVGLPADYIPDTATPSMKTGMYAARRDLISPSYGSYKDYNEPNVRSEYTFVQPLYTATCAAALVLDPRTAKFTDVKVYTTGFATDFNVADSTFIFDNFPMIISEQVTLHNTPWLCYCTAQFPSREPSGNHAAVKSRAIDTSVYPDQPPYRIDTDEPFLYDDCGKTIWRYDVYVKMVDKQGKESVTRTLINIRHPLRAGQLKIIVGYIDDQGVIRLYDNELGGSVDLQWETGWIFNPVIG